MAEALEPPFDRPDRGFNALNGWTWVGTYGGHYLQADLLAGFEHGFFTRQWQGREPDALVAFLSAGVSVHRLRQVHSAIVLGASEAVAAPWPQADGLVSDDGGQSLWVCGADCTPVLIADPEQGRVAACHTGWRGVAARIVPAAIARLEAAGSRREALLVALGPAVSGQLYQVERAVSEQVAASLISPGGPAAHGNPAGAGPACPDSPLERLRRAAALFEDPEPGRDRLDIRAATVAQLLAEGLAAERISSCPSCTHGEPALFHSWRRDRVRAVQWSGIVSQD
ncbi:MAG: peptidoglycan editing factor PgeF [Synechococcaceae cyanobacterium]|nr:peptidoglycan editing factor PgeF [Synechococcaceae cyanobacterium]